MHELSFHIIRSRCGSTSPFRGGEGGEALQEGLAVLNDIKETSDENLHADQPRSKHFNAATQRRGAQGDRPSSLSFNRDARRKGTFRRGEGGESLQEGFAVFDDVGAAQHDVYAGAALVRCLHLRPRTPSDDKYYLHSTAAYHGNLSDSLCYDSWCAPSRTF
jgi:hypothetical protein